VKHVVVLGTGTNVGKTHVTCALARSLHKAAPNLPVACLKPVESGFHLSSSDARRLAEVSNGVELPLPLPRYALEAALSPHLASRLAGLGSISLDAIGDWLAAWRTALPPPVREQGWCLIESAGGVFSPLAPGVTNFDLAQALEPSLWVLVAPDSLGVLHDVTTTLATCRLRGREPDLLVLSAARTPDASTGTNRAELATLGIAAVVDVVARDGEFADRLAHAVLART
jgi:dethiobiotin synthetase